MLALVSEGTTHGWALARLLEPTGDVGRVWTVRRALVYRALTQLEALGLVREAGDAPSERGPRGRWSGPPHGADRSSRGG